MGRYYFGDIEGKFWFGIQSSDDFLKFGARELEPSQVQYYIDDETAVREGINFCEQEINRITNGRLDLVNEYLNETIGDSELERRLNHPTDFQHVLTLSARLSLGRQILGCIIEKGDCLVDADL